jgi:hypothetical protein
LDGASILALRERDEARGLERIRASPESNRAPSEFVRPREIRAPIEKPTRDQVRRLRVARMSVEERIESLVDGRVRLCLERQDNRSPSRLSIIGVGKYSTIKELDRFPGTPEFRRQNRETSERRGILWIEGDRALIGDHCIRIATYRAERTCV